MDQRGSKGIFRNPKFGFFFGFATFISQADSFKIDDKACLSLITDMATHLEPRVMRRRRKINSRG